MNGREVFAFRLYIAGEARNSSEALANLTDICGAYLPDRHSIEVVDVLKDPRRALADGVFLTPSLIKTGPSPARRLVGSLSQTATVLQVLGLRRSPA